MTPIGSITNVVEDREKLSPDAKAFTMKNIDERLSVHERDTCPPEAADVEDSDIEEQVMLMEDDKSHKVVTYMGELMAIRDCITKNDTVEAMKLIDNIIETQAMEDCGNG